MYLRRVRSRDMQTVKRSTLLLSLVSLLGTQIRSLTFIFRLRLPNDSCLEDILTTLTERRSFTLVNGHFARLAY